MRRIVWITGNRTNRLYVYFETLNCIFMTVMEEYAEEVSFADWFGLQHGH